MTIDTKKPQAFYDEEAVNYDSIRMDGDCNTVNHYLQIKVLDRYLRKFNRDARVLEIAPGTGRITKLLASKFDKIVAVDISENMVSVLKQRDWYDPEKLDIIISDITLMDFDERFDLIIFINAASHMENFEGLVERISDAISDDGEIFFNFPNLISPYFLPGLIINKRKKSALRDVFTRWYRFSEVKKISKDNGLLTERYSGIIHAPLGLSIRFIRLIRLFNSIDFPLKFIGTQLFVLLRKNH